jgi:hypothetical protein
VPPVSEELAATLRNTVMNSSIAKGLLGANLSKATPTEVVPWYSDSGELLGHTVLLELAQPQNLPAKSGPAAGGLPGKYSGVTSLEIVVDAKGAATGASVRDGTLSPDTHLPIIHPENLDE